MALQAYETSVEEPTCNPNIVKQKDEKKGFIDIFSINDSVSRNFRKLSQGLVIPKTSRSQNQSRYCKEQASRSRLKEEECPCVHKVGIVSYSTIKRRKT